MRSFVVFFVAIIFIVPVLSGCKKKSTPPPAKTQASKEEKIEARPRVVAQETPDVEEGGYIYERRGRRDPFKPLIEVKKVAKGKGSKVTGTLESYDIGDFSVLAIAKKGTHYYALLLAPDNKSFTVNEGDVIGLHKGKVEKILSDKVIILEYTKDYHGKLKPRQIALELQKGR